jgi:BioD-like phosphotransacetylase family protein
MKIELNTSSRAVEAVNFLLGQVLYQLEQNEKLRKSLLIGKNEIKSARSFQKQLLEKYSPKEIIIYSR